MIFAPDCIGAPTNEVGLQKEPLPAENEHTAEENGSADSCEDYPEVGSFRCLSIDEIRNTQKPTYIIDGLLIKSQSAVVGGPEKSLKTTNMVAQALSIATGRRYFERDVSRSRVTYFASLTECGGGLIEDVIDRAQRSMDITDAELIGWFRLVKDVPQLESAQEVRDCLGIVERSRTGVAYFDNFVNMTAGGQAPSAFGMIDLIKPLTDGVVGLGGTPVRYVNKLCFVN